ncbi:Regulatory protein blaR1 [Fibrisoma limi BUZ 3]|uniref:Regulatory protein blaR1 n=1 Tax=Fibrisoma limi BUZ 3 TaxID=1185876 RepID=I2GR81_9BACT|nr:M56 family metallopeptidase [Fibrisoma limi]CCH56409.1 Regulatory protein blaR1 [Fibrisoma limi BUZ 3]
MQFSHFLSGPVAHALGWTLLHALWQGFAIVLPTAIILHVLRRRSSNLRYTIGVATLFAQLLISALTFGWYYEPLPTATAVNSPALIPALPIYWQSANTPLPWYQSVLLFLESHLTQFVMVYLMGVAVFGLRLTGGWLYLQQLRRAATRPATAQLVALTERLRERLAIRSVIQTRESAQITVPMVVGVLKPVLLLPIGLTTGLTIQEVEAVLAHELAHVKRHDYAVNLLQSVVEVLYFFHPALWWLSARVREEREHCCDDLAVQACGNSRVLAQALAHVEELRLVQAPALAVAFASKRQQLLHRVRRVLGVPTRPLVSNGSLAGLTLATILLMSASVYAVQQNVQQEKRHERSTQNKPKGKTEFGLLDNNSIEYVIWHGKRLPARRISHLKAQLVQLKEGNLQLSQITNETDRDILEHILEASNENKALVRVDTLVPVWAELDYNTIMSSAFEAANAAGSFPADEATMATVLTKIGKLDYNRIISGALSGVKLPNVSVLDSLPDNYLSDQRRHLDSLGRMMEQKQAQMEALHQQMEKAEFQAEEMQRRMSLLDMQKNKAMQQRLELIEKQREQLEREQQKSDEELEKRFKEFEQKIKDSESNVERYNKLIEDAQKQLREAEKPLAELQRKMERLEQEASMSELGYNDNLNLELNRTLNHDLNRNLDGRARRATTIPRVRRPGSVRGALSPAAPLVPGTATAPGPTPSVAPVIVPGVPAPALAPTPSIPGATTKPPRTPKAVKPAKTPKPAKASSAVYPATETSVSLAELDRLIDQHSGIEQATFIFKENSQQRVRVKSATFVKHNASTATATAPVINEVETTKK